MNDLFSNEILNRRFVISKAISTFNQYGFSEIQTPILEEADIFIRSAGVDSDIITKEMYTFKDDNKKIICARPEGTAGIIRALVQHKMISDETELKVFYIGSMFRKERPQKGRFREFCQIGAEFIGCNSVTVDIEFLSMVYDWLSNLPLKNPIKLLINNLGEPEERDKYVQQLKTELSPRIAMFCEFCKDRFQRNTLRLLDCKNPNCKEMTSSIPPILDFVSTESKMCFTKIQQGLNDLKIPFEVSDKLVRGLDYYTDTVFEFISESGLGSQNTLAGGGRYNKLIHTLGGPPNVPAIGMAAGLERILLLLKTETFNLKHSSPDLAIIYADEIGQKKAFELSLQLRKKGICVDFEHGSKSVKSQMRRANRLRTKNVIVIGAREANSDMVYMKSMDSGIIRPVKLSLIEKLMFE